jgi:hypothetical protein
MLSEAEGRKIVREADGSALMASLKLGIVVKEIGSRSMAAVEDLPVGMILRSCVAGGGERCPEMIGGRRT